MTRTFSRIARIVLVAAVAATVLAAVACSGDTGGSSAPADAVRAHVNGREVRQSAVDAVRAEARFDSRSDAQAKPLNEAIDRELVRQEARRLGVKADQAEVDKRAAALSKRAGGDDALATLLTKARMTQQQLRASLTYGVLREALQNVRFSDMAAGEPKLRRFYEHNLKSLFTVPASVHLGALVTHSEGIASNAIKRLRQGRPFSEVARQFSADPQLKQDGGDMGWVAPASIPPELRKVVNGLALKAVSKPVQSVGGWYVFKLLGRKAAKVIPYATVRDDLATELNRRQRSAALDAWLEKAKAAATISRP
jgi:parvulin-like peptidyl-prolyl isomerase